MSAVLERPAALAREYWYVMIATVLAFGLLAYKQQWHHPAPPSPWPVWVDPLLTHTEVAQ